MRELTRGQQDKRQGAIRVRTCTMPLPRQQLQQGPVSLIYAKALDPGCSLNEKTGITSAGLASAQLPGCAGQSTTKKQAADAAHLCGRKQVGERFATARFSKRLHVPPIKQQWPAPAGEQQKGRLKIEGSTKMDKRKIIHSTKIHLGLFCTRTGFMCPRTSMLPKARIHPSTPELTWTG